MTQLGWQARTVKRVAEKINELRGERSAQWLSDRTEALGHRVSRSTISDLETGRRSRLDVAELIVLAAALEVPPIVLLYPDLPDGEVEVLPHHKSSAWLATQWFSGEVPLLTDLTTFKYEDDDELTPEKEWTDAFEGGGRTLRYLRDWTEAATYLSDLNKVLPKGLSDSRATLAAVEQGVKRLRSIEQAMLEHGVSPPTAFWDGRVETRISRLVDEDEEDERENEDAQPPF